MAWRKDPHFLLGEGIDRRIEYNNPEYPSGALWDALNMVYERDSEEPEKMRGFSRLGSVDMTGQVSGLFDYAEGTELIATTTGGFVYKRTTGEFAQVTGGSGFSSATTTRWTASMFYGATATANILVMCNGVDAPQFYTTGGGIGALAGSPPSTGKYPVPFVGRLWMASGSTLYYSAANDCQTWTTPGGQVQVHRGDGDITGLTVFAGNLIIFKRHSIYRILPTSNITETMVREVSHNTGCVSHHTIKEINIGKGERLVLAFLSEYGVQGLVPTSSSGGFSVSHLSSPVQKILDRRSEVPANQTTFWADYNQGRTEYYLNYSTGSGIPNEGLICNSARNNRPIRWTQHNINGITAGASYRSSTGIVQLIGNTGGQVFQMHSGNDRNGAAYTGRLFTPAWAQGAYDEMKEYGRVFVDARTEGTYAVQVRILVGRKDLPTPAGQTIPITDFSSLDGWGVGEWGVAMWGGAGKAGQHIRPHKVSRGYHLRLLVYTIDKNQWFKVCGSTVQYELTAPSIAA